jgi:hypothetical protein
MSGPIDHSRINTADIGNISISGGGFAKLDKQEGLLRIYDNSGAKVKNETTGKPLQYKIKIGGKQVKESDYATPGTSAKVNKLIGLIIKSSTGGHSKLGQNILAGNTKKLTVSSNSKAITEEIKTKDKDTEVVTEKTNKYEESTAVFGSGKKLISQGYTGTATRTAHFASNMVSRAASWSSSKLPPCIKKAPPQPVTINHNESSDNASKLNDAIAEHSPNLVHSNGTIDKNKATNFLDAQADFDNGLDFEQLTNFQTIVQQSIDHQDHDVEASGDFDYGVLESAISNVRDISEGNPALQKIIDAAPKRPTGAMQTLKNTSQAAGNILFGKDHPKANRAANNAFLNQISSIVTSTINPSTNVVTSFIKTNADTSKIPDNIDSDPNLTSEEKASYKETVTTFKTIVAETARYNALPTDTDKTNFDYTKLRTALNNGAKAAKNNKQLQLIIDLAPKRTRSESVQISASQSYGSTAPPKEVVTELNNDISIIVKDLDTNDDNFYTNLEKELEELVPETNILSEGSGVSKGEASNNTKYKEALSHFQTIAKELNELKKTPQPMKKHFNFTALDNAISKVKSMSKGQITLEEFISTAYDRPKNSMTTMSSIGVQSVCNKLDGENSPASMTELSMDIKNIFPAEVKGLTVVNTSQLNTMMDSILTLDPKVETKPTILDTPTPQEAKTLKEVKLYNSNLKKFQDIRKLTNKHKSGAPLNKQDFTQLNADIKAVKRTARDETLLQDIIADAKDAVDSQSTSDYLKSFIPESMVSSSEEISAERDSVGSDYEVELENDSDKFDEGQCQRVNELIGNTDNPIEFDNASSGQGVKNTEQLKDTSDNFVEKGLKKLLGKFNEIKGYGSDEMLIDISKEDMKQLTSDIDTFIKGLPTDENDETPYSNITKLLTQLKDNLTPKTL